MFALTTKPQNPELERGELLLLQLVKQDAIHLDKVHGRIDFGLIFDRLEPDSEGQISRLHWPAEGRVWNWIVYGLATVPTIPFSLEDLSLSKSYDGQDNARFIEPGDEQLILPLVQWSLAGTPEPDRQLVPPSQIAENFGPSRTLAGIYNHDRIVILQPPPRRIVVVEQVERNPCLADSLKSYYDYHCQVCNFDFRPRFGVRAADAHHIQYLRNNGPDVSTNMLILCPNHHRAIHASDARFHRDLLEYEYPNGLREQLQRPDHIKNAPTIITGL